MPSTTALEISNNYAANAPSATDKISASVLDNDHSTLESWASNLLTALNRVIRADDTLVDGIVRTRNLHPEITALLTDGGMVPLESAKTVATTNVASLSGLQTISSYTLVAGDRILLTAQTNNLQNGLWVAAAGSWTRPTDSANGASLTAYSIVNIVAGSQFGTSWMLKAAVTSVDSTGQTWVLFGATIVSSALGDPGANGIVVRTASTVTTNRSIAGSSSIGVTNGDGVSGNPTISVATAGVTYAMLQNTSSASVLLGRGSSIAGVPQEITLGSGLAITGTVMTAASAQFWSKIASATVVSITAAGSATLNRLHEVSGTSANYDITISGLSPAVGDVVGFYVKDYAAANKAYRLDAGTSGSPKIAGRTRYLTILHTNVVLLQWDGTDWQPLELSLNTPWVDGGTNTITGSVTNPTKGTIARDKVLWRRIGDSLQANIEYLHTTAGTNGSGYYIFALPLGAIDTSKIHTGGGGVTPCLGAASGYNGTLIFSGYVTYNSSTSVQLIEGCDTVSTGSVGSGRIGFGNTSAQVGANYTVPMTDW
jgi:hypothetical protein